MFTGYKYLLLVICMLIVGDRVSAQQSTLLPSPVQERLSYAKTFHISGETDIISENDEFRVSISVFKGYMENWNNIKWNSVSSKKGNSIKIIKEKQSDTAGYRLEITPRQILIKASTNSGIGNAFSSLLQLSINQLKPLEIPTGVINDLPKYAWRGFMLDESRHFFGKKEVKRLLDQMYLFKLNRFHWHLTDEPAWRLDIKRYPLLTEIGSKGNYTDSGAKKQYYTQDDIREIVSYAVARNITIIPEIDMPGHATAANKAYPEYSGGGSVKHPDFTFNPGKEEVYTYLTNILREVHTLFPSGMVHLGGDEVSFGNEKWNIDPDILKLRKKYSLKNNLEVEHYFIQRMSDSTRKLGMKVLGWDEMADADLPTDSTILIWWRHNKPSQLQLALSKGYPVILSPRIPFYFDFVQSNRDVTGRRWGNDFGTYDDILNFPPDSLLDKKQQKHIVGIQANLWTETVKTKDRLEYLVFPRLVAMSCTAWSSQKQTLTNFTNKLNVFYSLWQKLGIKYYDVTRPENTPEISDKSREIKYLDEK